MASDNADTCLSCNELLPADGLFASCCECGYNYHLGSCSGLSEGAFRSRGKASKKAWKCITCKTVERRGGQSTGKQKCGQDSVLAEELAAINRKLAEILPIREKVEALMEIKNTINDIESSVQTMSNKYDELLNEMKGQKKDIVHLTKRVEKLELRTTDDEVRKLKQELNELDQYSRRQNMEIHGIPPVDGENLLNTLNTLASQLELSPLNEASVDAVHRLPSRPNKIPPIIVRFTSRMTRDKWFAKKTELRTAHSSTYFMENLTAQNKRLLWLIKAKAAEMNYQFAWQKNGRMFVRKRAQDRVIRIEGEDDLVKIQ